MPAVNFRRFSKPEVLSTVEPRLLLRLLSRHEDYFSSRGCALTINGNGCLNYSGIIETILSPDQKMPSDLIDALYFTHELATPKGLDAMLGALGNGHAAQYRNLTPLDVAVRAYLDAPETFQQVYRQSMVFRRRTFVYFKAFSKLNYPDRIPPPLIAQLEKAFSDYYASRGRGSHCRIYVFRQDHEIWFTVRHGDPFQREVDVEDPNRASYVFRPERYSTIVLDSKQGGTAACMAGFLERRFQAVVRVRGDADLRGWHQVFEKSLAEIRHPNSCPPRLNLLK